MLLLYFCVYIIYYLFIYPKIEKKYYDKVIKKIKIGDKFYSQVQFEPIDPFQEPPSPIYIIIEDIKVNKNGDTWYKVKWSDGT